jgi:hypothetical protein
MKFLRFTALLFCLLVAGPAPAGPNKDAANALVDDFNASHRSVRPAFLAYPAYSLIVDGADHACHFPPALRRLAAGGETFRIRKLHVKKDHFRIELETPGRRRLTLYAYSRGELDQRFLDVGLRRLLEDVFNYGTPPPPVAFVGHVESRLLHLDRCNHLPEQALQRPFAAAAEAEAAGFTRCPICFGAENFLPYPGYTMHRASGLQAARLFELLYPPSDDAALQQKLEELGATVLSGWPLDLAGFDYDFGVVRADLPLAVSFRTGIIRVSDTMMRAADSDEELIFVLAHEITHCEIHLPPRSPYADIRGLAPLSVEFLAWREWSMNQQLAADLVALSWFEAQPEGAWKSERARAALSKIQYVAGETEYMVAEPGQALGLHERLRLFDDAVFKPGDPRRVMIGVDGEGDVRYEIRFLGLYRNEVERETVPYFLLSTTDYEEEARTVSRVNTTAGEFWDAAGRKSGFYVKPYISKPNFTTLVIGWTEFGDYFGKFTPGPLQGASLWGLNGVKKWRVGGRADGY